MLQRSQEVRKALDLLKLLDNGETVHNRMGGTFDLNQFQHQIDTETAAVMGHSFGGGTVVQVLSEDARFRQDNVIWVMFVTADSSGVELHWMLGCFQFTKTYLMLE